jgi:hypothetical protein
MPTKKFKRIRLYKYQHFFATRQSVQKIREEIESNGNGAVTLDFVGVGAMTHAAMDELVGKLLEQGIRVRIDGLQLFHNMAKTVAERRDSLRWLEAS